MTFRKRGLGRGLEALLADDSAKEKIHQSQAVQSEENQPSKEVDQDAAQAIEEVDDQAAMVVALFKNIQKENRMLLEEAEALRKLIEEFEATVRASMD
ncbi:MAG: hypothetical protein M0R47_03100 [Methylobacter sp.]|jgi:hypothetical protein|uniref:hypothetical protein n=1 Tax=Methylobacter sp. TaxID=2051955 RepID=UPI0025DE0771|nr:hypothetical protein [Methylobacter sp.]MCK9619501.1 hypothetical protein [Methylobacter sp.]